MQAILFVQSEDVDGDIQQLLHRIYHGFVSFSVRFVLWVVFFSLQEIPEDEGNEQPHNICVLFTI